MKKANRGVVPRPIVILLALLSVGTAISEAADWSRYRGPNGSGVSDTVGLPIEFGPAKNMVYCGTAREGLPTAKKLQSIETLSFYRWVFGIVVGSLCGIEDFTVASSPSEWGQAHWSS